MTVTLIAEHLRCAITSPTNTIAGTSGKPGRGPVSQECGLGTEESGSADKESRGPGGGHVKNKSECVGEKIWVSGETTLGKLMLCRFLRRGSGC